MALDIFHLNGIQVAGYCENEQKKANPFGLEFLGSEKELDSEMYQKHRFFVGIGDNLLRARIYGLLKSRAAGFVTAIHPSASVADKATIGEGSLIAAKVCINPMAEIGEGVICNTSSVVEHDCRIGDYSHIAPGAVLCGNVTIGKNCFIGANSVLIEGTTIADNVIIGAGSTVVRNILSSGLYFGSPARERTIRNNKLNK